MTRGVFCLFCGCAIPLVPRLEHLVRSQRVEARAEVAERGLIVLQCKTCCKDAPYPAREIVLLDRPEPSRAFEPRKRRAANYG